MTVLLFQIEGSIREVAMHGFAEDRKDAAMKSFNAGLDVDMESSAYLKHMKELVQEGKVSVKQIENSVACLTDEV